MIKKEKYMRSVVCEERDREHIVILRQGRMNICLFLLHIY